MEQAATEEAYGFSHPILQTLIERCLFNSDDSRPLNSPSHSGSVNQYLQPSSSNAASSDANSISLLAATHDRVLFPPPAAIESISLNSSAANAFLP